MADLKDFLKEKSKQANQLERRKRREDWTSSVACLISQLQQWIRQADPDRVLDVEVIPIEKHEQSIGAYVANSLEIRCDDAIIRVLPIACATMRWVPLDNPDGHAEGRVDIMSAANKFTLYRIISGQEYRWMLHEGPNKASPFDQARFEQIMQELLS